MDFFKKIVFINSYSWHSGKMVSWEWAPLRSFASPTIRKKKEESKEKEKKERIQMLTDKWEYKSE